MVNFKQVCIEFEHTLENRDFTSSIELSALCEFTQSPTVTKLLDIFFVDSFICIVCINGYRRVNATKMCIRDRALSVLRATKQLLSSLFLSLNSKP